VASGASTAIDLAGLPETRRLLRRFEPDLLRRLDAKMNATARDLRSAAQANFARTGAGGSAYRIISRSRIDGFSKSVTTQGGSVAPRQKWSSEPGVLAAIFELMASPRDARPQNVPRVRSLIATLNERYGTPGRFLWEAWDDSEGGYEEEVHAEIRAVEAEYSARLSA
jgi:hypothetical protein